jgi:hypothetical protein
MAAHLVSTTVSVQSCRRCGCLVLAAWAEGVMTYADVAPVTPTGEYVALASGRPSYVLRGGCLVERGSWRMDLEGPVVIAHRCGDPPLLVAESEPNARQSRYVLDPDGPIPF